MTMFSAVDAARRRAGQALDAAGAGPREAPFGILAEWPGARLRRYEPERAESGPPLLILPAPFKRPYIWDLLPEVSVVRRCLERGLPVHLLEWLDPTEAQDGMGLSDYAGRLPALAVDAIAAATGRDRLVLAGHSLGGTFAAIQASLYPERVAALVLVDAPLAFGSRGGPIAEAVAALPHARALRAGADRPMPGSLIGLLSAAAVPQAFVGQVWADHLASLGDAAARAIHARVRRWTLDEFALPGQLFEDVVELLYRHDRFLDGSLEIDGRTTGVERLRGPLLAVVNPVGHVVPPDSMLAALERLPGVARRVLRYEGDRGVAIQHLGPLVAPVAHARLWPAILDWVREVAA